MARCAAAKTAILAILAVLLGPTVWKGSRRWSHLLGTPPAVGSPLEGYSSGTSQPIDGSS